MSKFRVTHLQRLIQKLLRDTNLEWHIESGKKHRKLYIEGRMVMVFSHGPSVHNDIQRIESFVRRAQETKNADQIRAV